MMRLASAAWITALVVGYGAAAERRPTDENLKALVADLKKPDVEARRKAAAAISDLCKDGDVDPAGVVADLIDALKDTDPIVRGAIAEALGFIGPDAQAAIPAVQGLLKDPIPEVRAKAAFALGGFGDEAKGAVPAIVSLLKDKVETVRASAAAGLGEIGSAAKAAVPLGRASRPRNRFPCARWRGGIETVKAEAEL